MMRIMRMGFLAGATALLASAGMAHAGVYNMSVTETTTGGNGFNAVAGGLQAVGGNTATASFTFTGALFFDNTAQQNPPPTGDLNSTFGFSTSNISNYTGSGTVTYNSTGVANYATLGSFLNSSGSASGYVYGSLYTIDLGTLAAGTIVTFTHDDGASLFESGQQIGTSVTGPTTAVTDTVTVGTTGDITLYYSRQNGTPSVLEVSVPEPISLTLLGTGLVGLGLARRRQRRAA